MVNTILYFYGSVIYLVVPSYRKEHHEAGVRHRGGTVITLDPKSLKSFKFCFAGQLFSLRRPASSHLLSICQFFFN